MDVADMPKRFKEFLEEQKKSSIEPEYDTTRMNDAMRERMKKSLRREELHSD